MGTCGSLLLGMEGLKCRDFIHVDCYLVPFRENNMTVGKACPKDDGCKFR